MSDESKYMLQPIQCPFCRTNFSVELTLVSNLIGFIKMREFSAKDVVSLLLLIFKKS